MSQLIIRPLKSLEGIALNDFIQGYVSQEKYQVSRDETAQSIVFRLELITLDAPYVKHYDLNSFDFYQALVDSGFSLGAYWDNQLVGLALADVQHWNRSMQIHELHVLAAYQGQGIGRKLLEALALNAREADLRIMVCETQNTNVPALRFYQKCGFQLEALDLSLYSNADSESGEIALFMKRRLD